MQPELNIVEDTNDEVEGEVLIREAFDDAVDKDKTEDEIKMEMIKAGASFKNVARMYNQFMIDAGLAMAKEDRAAVVQQAFSNYDITSEAGYNGAIEFIVDKAPGTTSRSAQAQIRSYAKKNELQVYVPEKESAGPTGFTRRYLDWIITTVKETGEVPSLEVSRDYIHGRAGYMETSANTKRNESHFLNYVNFASRLIQK